VKHPQEELAYAWNARWHPARNAPRFNAPVAYVPNPEERNPDYRERYVTTAYGMAYVRDSDGEPVAWVRLIDYGERGQARLDRLEVLEDVVTKLGQMSKPDGDEAIQRYPECPDCYVEMNWDEGFDCPVCLTHFNDNCAFSHKVCVEYECSDDADMVGDDGQPRCTNCTVLILAGEQSPFDPYECRRCKTNVVGIPSRSKAGKNRYCGTCQAAKDRDEYLADILGRRS
jgi:hypothetical protein